MRVVGCLWVAFLCSGCSVYDPSLLERRDASMSDARNEEDTGTDDDSGATACVPSTDEFCAEICPETCNLRDDDCDGMTDEASSGSLCHLDNASAGCVDGECFVFGCQPGFEDCDGAAQNGCETSLRTPDNCGGCGVACNIPGASAVCVQDTCVFAECLAGFGNCDGNPGNGCELRVDTLEHCGRCRLACGSVEHGQPACSDGACGISECDVGFEDCDGDASNGCETSLDALASCGTCDTQCSFPQATSVCAGRTCVLESCQAGYADCDAISENGCEVALQTDVFNCGACFRNCDASGGGMFQCNGGECEVASCPTGLADCDADSSNGCERSTTALTDCGSCDAACSFDNAVASCANRTCTFVACQAGFGDCNNDLSDGCETSLNTDSHCGTCTTTCDTSVGRMCSGGVCSLVACPGGRADCDNDGVDCEQSLSTLLHCGTCNAACGDAQGRLANATATCATGTCAVASCTGNFDDCDGAVGNGCETSLRTAANCGACGTACSRPNASVTCATGSCAIATCNTGFANCDGNDVNGCETSTNTNQHCGGCNVTCSQPNAVTSCGSGTCVRVSCNAGFGDCDNNPANGCETPLTSLNHCGACNTPCALANASESCASGTCTLGTCEPGFGNCDFAGSNGCETPLDTTTNCNGCGMLCDYPNASETCTAGACALTTCTTGFGNCDTNAANGCEQALTSTSHCGACNVGCSRANATATCSSGSCAIGSCSTGYGNCDGNAANGCETQLNSAMHCGACNAACGVNDNRTCSGGVCSLSSCPMGTADCDNDGTTCEQALNTNSHCGGCNVPCSRANASASCSTGTCALGTCTSGFANCDSVASNGCEQALNTNSHCGGCNTACTRVNATASCASGTCTLGACNPGYGNCDGNDANGCETNLNSTASCGTTCANRVACGSGQTCVSNACVTMTTSVTIPFSNHGRYWLLEGSTCTASNRNNICVCNGNANGCSTNSGGCSSASTCNHNDNRITGSNTSSGSNVYRNRGYWVFSLASLPMGTTIVSAQVEFSNGTSGCGFTKTNTTTNYTFTLTRPNTPVATLINTAAYTYRSSYFDDLAASAHGPSETFGAVSTRNTAAPIVVNVTPAGISMLQAAVGTSIAMGGQYQEGTTGVFLFCDNNGFGGTADLRLTVVYP